MDLYNMAIKKGQLDYGKLLDAIKIGQGAAGSAGAASQNMGNQLSSVYGNVGNAQASNALLQGNNMSNLMGGISSGAQNLGLLYGMGGGFGSSGFSLANLFK
jgi:hypothetical protein